MDSDSIAFWGVRLTPKEPMTLELQGGESLNVTMASLSHKLVDKAGRSVVMVHTGEIEQKFAVCVLNAGSTESFSLDLHFEGEEKITFTLIGKNEVHLTGNFSFDDEDEDDDEGDDLMETLQGDLMELEDAEEDADSDDNDILDDAPVVEELEEDENDDEEYSSEEEKEVSKPKATPKSSQKKKGNPATPQGNGIPASKKTSQKKPKKVVEKAPPKVEKSELKVEKSEHKVEATKDNKVKTPKRKAAEANAQTPSKKTKGVNGNAAPTTPPPKTPEAQKSAPTPSESGTGKKSKKRNRKRASKAGNTPAK